MLEILKEVFSCIIFTKRTELNYSQETMEEKCCLSVRQYIDPEHGLYLPSFKTLINIKINIGFDFNKFIDLIINMGYESLDREN